MSKLSKETFNKLTAYCNEIIRPKVGALSKVELEQLVSEITREEFMDFLVNRVSFCPSKLGLTESGCQSSCENCYRTAVKDCKFKDDIENERKQTINQIIKEYKEKINTDVVSEKYTRGVARLLTKDEFYGIVSDYCPSRLGFGVTYCLSRNSCEGCLKEVLGSNNLKFKDSNNDNINSSKISFSKGDRLEAIKSFKLNPFFTIEKGANATISDIKEGRLYLEFINMIINIKENEVNEYFKKIEIKTESKDDNYPLSQEDVEEFMRKYIAVKLVSHSSNNSPYISIELTTGGKGESCCQEGDNWDTQIGMEVAYWKAVKNDYKVKRNNRLKECSDKYDLQIDRLQDLKKSEMKNIKNSYSFGLNKVYGELNKFYK